MSRRAPGRPANAKSPAPAVKPERDRLREEREARG
jgi:hypothetical protein